MHKGTAGLHGVQLGKRERSVFEACHSLSNVLQLKGKKKKKEKETPSLQQVLEAKLLLCEAPAVTAPGMAEFKQVIIQLPVQSSAGKHGGSLCRCPHEDFHFSMPTADLKHIFNMQSHRNNFLVYGHAYL